MQSPVRSWQGEASCRGPESAMFFPPPYPERKEERESRERHAKAICAGCPVLARCREYALTIREPYGIWGGLTELERRLRLLDEVG